MTINSETRVAGPFEGNDSTVTFPFAFKVFAADELLVVRATNSIETVLVLNTNYSVALNPDQNAAPGGSVTLTAPLASGSRLTLTSDMEYLQPLDLTNQGGFYPRVINNAFDRVTMLLQQLKAIANRTLKFPLSDGAVGDLPGRADRKGTVLAFHETTAEPIVGPSIAQLGTVANGIVAIGIVASNIDDVNTVAGSIGNVNAVGGSIGNVNILVNDLANVDTVAENIGDVNIVAANIDDVTNFSGVYYGGSATDPTTRRDGSPLQPGDLYFNTTTGGLRGFSGSGWKETVVGATTLQNFSGDGSTTEFHLDVAPESELVTQVYIHGVYQQKNTYSLGGALGDLLVFDAAPPVGANNIEVTMSSLVWTDGTLMQDLAASGTAMVGDAATGLKLDEILATRIFPGIILDHATTSWAKIVSADYTEDKSAELSNFLDLHPNATFDTQIALNNTVTVLKSRSQIQCSPGGILLNGPGMAQKSMLKITGHHVNLHLMNMDNPAMLKASSGGRQTAINIQADHCTVSNSYFKNMLHAAMTESNGEWYGTVYFRNIADECLGTGPGPSDDGSSGLGEDRGDAFLIWGATGMMLYNKAFCKAGQDARIAFHCESLGNGYHTRPNNAARDGFDYWMLGNFAFGGFRRHFAFEAVDRAIMSKNVSGGGATWWPIAITGCNDSLGTDMVVYYDRQASNTAGAAWSPERAAIAVGHNGKNVTLRNIEAHFAVGAVGAGLTSLVTANTMLGVVLDGIRILKPVGQGGLGLVLDKLPDVRVLDCQVTGAQHGITTFGAQDNLIKGFNASDLTGDAIRLTGGGGVIAHARVEGGRFERVNNGVVTNNLTTLSFRGTQLKDVAVNDLNQFGTTGAITIEGLHNENGTGKLVGMGSPFQLTQVRNVENNIGYSYDFRHVVACFTDATSAINTSGKYQGKRLMRSDGVMLMALGSTPTSPWGVVATTTPVTPA